MFRWLLQTMLIKSVWSPPLAFDHFDVVIHVLVRLPTLMKYTDQKLHVHLQKGKHDQADMQAFLVKG